VASDQLLFVLLAEHLDRSASLARRNVEGFQNHLAQPQARIEGIRRDPSSGVHAAGASTYSSIARGTLFRAKLPPKEEEGLLARIIKNLKAEYSVEEKELLLRASDYQDALLEAVAQGAVNLQKRMR
jgi:hypothetical protein